MALHEALVQAKMNYATDLALGSNTADPDSTEAKMRYSIGIFWHNKTTART